MSRKGMDVPCRFLFEEDSGETMLRAPSVNCGMLCKDCGWNPEERERRFLNGEMVKDENGITRLVFPRRAT